jgi:hypothetical protein
MPIEFRCPQCQRLLRVGDDAVGKQAKCPACGTLAQVPNSLAETAPTEPREFSPPLPSGANPFGGPGTNPFNAGAFTPPPIAPPSDNPYASPFSGGETATSTLRPTRISINNVFEDAWAVFKPNMGLMVLVYFVEWIITQVYSNGGQIPVMVIAEAVQNEAFLVVGLVGFVVTAMLLGIWLASGRALYYLETAKGQSPPFSRLFAGHSVLLRRFLLLLLYVLVIFGSILLAGGIGWAVTELSGDDDVGGVVGLAVGAVCACFVIWGLLVYGAAWFVVLDQDVGTIESLRISRQITAGNRLTLAGVYVLGALLSVAGVCACGIGTFVTTPLAYVAFIVAYMQMSGQPIVGASYVIPPRERALPAQPNF